MTPQRHNRDSAIRKDMNQYPIAESYTAVQPGTETGKHCAYNQTRQRFLSADVDAADFSMVSLDARLPGLAPNSGAGLWLIPFRGISPTSVRIPVDLIYLDRNCTVIDTVESFPLSGVSSSRQPSTSVLVLPADALRSTETQPGDQLILCSPNEMKRHLQRLADTQQVEQAAAPLKEAPGRGNAGRVLQWEDRSRLMHLVEMVPAHEELPAEPMPLVAEPQESEIPAPAEAVEAAAPVETIETAQKNVKPQKSWLKRLLSPDPPEPRKAARESLPGLAAHFFTGGAPVAHAVRDISLTGMYVFTTERWYLGTMVRMTLTDRHEPTVERSITLNATVIRWGNDGVGLRFVLHNGKGQRQRQEDGMSAGADSMQVAQFLERLRGAKA
jgi:hypothetical protein